MINPHLLVRSIPIPEIHKSIGLNSKATLYIPIHWEKRKGSLIPMTNILAMLINKLKKPKSTWMSPITVRVIPRLKLFGFLCPSLWRSSCMSSRLFIL